MNIRIALAGNPNCGKTTMFNALTGANQYVGNWPGVTVEKKEGKVRGRKGQETVVTDLPGIYSLSPYTLEEVVSRNYILHDNPDVIIDLVDATNIERNLYLTTQLIETGVPVVIALNMADLIEKRGLRIDTKRLSMVLGCPVIETSALKKTGLDAVIREAEKTADSKTGKLPGDIFSDELKVLFHLPAFPIMHCCSAVMRLKAGYGAREASSVKQLAKADIPMLFIHGTEDRFVSFRMLDINYQAKSRGYKEKAAFQGARHAESEYTDPEGYYGTIKRFLEKQGL